MHKGNANSLTPRNADDHVAVALARAAHGLEFGDGRMVEPNQPLALLIGLVLIADASERHGAGDGVKCGLADGDTDHVGDIGPALAWSRVPRTLAPCSNQRGGRPALYRGKPKERRHGTRRRSNCSGLLLFAILLRRVLYSTGDCFIRRQWSAMRPGEA